MGWKVYAHVYASTRGAGAARRVDIPSLREGMSTRASAQGDVGAVGKGGMSTRTSAHRLCREGARHA